MLIILQFLFCISVCGYLLCTGMICNLNIRTWIRLHTNIPADDLQIIFRWRIFFLVMTCVVFLVHVLCGGLGLL